MSFFFDAHLHATLKKQFVDPAAEGLPLPPYNPWHTATTKDFLKGFQALSLAKCVLRPFVESSLVSQSSLQQLQQHGFKLAIMALFAPDPGLMELIVANKQFIDIVRKGKFGVLLTESQFRNLQTTTNPFAVVLRDLQLLELSSEGRKVVKLRRGNFNPGSDSPLALVFSIEGLHCLRSDNTINDPAAITQDVLSNLDQLLTDNRVLCINLTHIDNGNAVFANHAYAMDGFREGGFVEKNLRPTGKGLGAAAPAVIRGLYDRGVLPDIKHMSWQSRRAFYSFRKEEGITAPIVASHVGFTGCAFNDEESGDTISKYIISSQWVRGAEGKRQRAVILSKPNPYSEEGLVGFNASSINLFDEDIKEVLLSDGLIGLSLDQRVLGFSDFIDRDGFQTGNVQVVADEPFGELRLLTDTDFISEGELPLLPQYQRGVNEMNGLRRSVQTTARRTVPTTDMGSFLHPKHFYLHVVHAMEVARRAAGEGGAIKMLTKVLCIGSDFDGLIDGIDCAADSTKMASFKNLFIREFPLFLRDLNLALPAGLTITQLANRLFYENGKEFVQRRIADG